MKQLKQWWPSILPVLTLIATALAPTIQSEVAKHPSASAAVALAYAVITHIMPSPVAPKQ